MDVFSTLPTEILRTIADSLLPDTLFSLGLTCKRVYQYLHDLVKAQRELAEKYSSVDTRHPLSAVTALRKILTDPIAAWHLRSINIWRMPWEIAAWDDRAGQDDINFLSYALEYPHIWNSSACKKIYKRMRERWRDFTYLQYGVDASGRAIRGAEVSQELADQHGYLTGHRNPCQEAFISNEEVKVFEALLEPFIANLANHHVNAGFGCRAIFLLVACAPRLRHVWHARPDESWAPWHTYLGKFFRKLGGSTTEQQGLHSSQDSLAPLSALRLRLPPGFFALRYVDLGEATPFFKHRSIRGPIRVQVVRNFLVLPNLELLRFAHNFHHPAFEDLQYIFEWESRNKTLRESMMTFTGEEGGHNPLNHWKYWPMKVLLTVFGNRIVNYECSTGTVQDIKALRRCSAQILESLTFINDTPDDLRWLLRGFSNLKTLTIGINYLTRHEGVAWCDLPDTVSLPASLEHLMVHSESHAKKRPREEKGRLKWAGTMHELGNHLILRLYFMLVLDQLPNLQSMCLIRIWGETTPDQLDSLVALTAERRISLHLWSGSPDPEVRICAHLCGRFVPTEKKHFRWPDGPRSWNFYSNYNWVTGRDELQYGSRYPYNLPQTNDEREMPIQFLHEWNENFFKDRIKELYTNPNEVHELVDLNLVENSLDSLDSSKFDMLVDNLCKRYKVEEDKARRVKESMELGRKVVDQLGGEGGRLVCKDFKWQRVYD